MPKVIKGLDERIFKEAFDLFVEEGFDQVDMKKIAKRCGIAVGTLYNYYSNKMELFEKVIMASWEKTFNRMDRALEEDGFNREILDRLIEILYEDLMERRGVGKYLSRAQSEAGQQSAFHEYVERGVRERLGSVISRIIEAEQLEIPQGTVERIAIILMVNPVQLGRWFPSDDERNCEFLKSMVHGALGKKGE